MVFVQGVQSIQNGNNMHKEVYKDLHKSVHLCIQKYTKVLINCNEYMGMQKYTKLETIIAQMCLYLLGEDD